MRRTILCAITASSLIGLLGIPAVADCGLDGEPGHCSIPTGDSRPEGVHPTIVNGPPPQDTTTLPEEIAPGVICEPTCPKPTRRRQPIKRRLIQARRPTRTR